MSNKYFAKRNPRINKKWIDFGTEVELEHTNNLAQARKIALDHLQESPNYYKDWNKKERLLMKARVSDSYKLNPLDGSIIEAKVLANDPFLGIVVEIGGELYWTGAPAPHKKVGSKIVVEVVNDSQRRIYAKNPPGKRVKVKPEFRKAVSQKISELYNEGYPQEQAVAIALNMYAEGKLGKRGGYKRTRKKK